MNIPALTCQLLQTAGSLNHGLIDTGTLEELQALAAANELLANVIYCQIAPLLELERETNPAPTAGPARGLLDLIGKGGVA